MTREETRDAVKVMEAYANGKKIQYKEISEWLDTSLPLFNWAKYKYRVKPEPKYRPFETKEECWNEMLKHQPFGWVVTKNTDAYVHICSVCGEYAGQPPKVVFEYRNPCFTFEQIFSIYNFADGAPFGIKEE